MFASCERLPPPFPRIGRMKKSKHELKNLKELFAGEERSKEFNSSNTSSQISLRRSVFSCMSYLYPYFVSKCTVKIRFAN